jgi:ketopantoate hydroxymethyltransferase
VKRYLDGGKLIGDAFKSFVSEVKSGDFPKEEHSFQGTPETLNKLY